MSLTAVWMDREVAKIFQFSAERMERKTLQSSHQDHHTHRPDEIDKQIWEQKFYREVSDELESSDRILILGPGVARHHFQNYLTEHLPAVGRKVVACQTMDHPTDQQIAAAAKKAFYTPQSD